MRGRDSYWKGGHARNSIHGHCNQRQEIGCFDPNGRARLDPVLGHVGHELIWDLCQYGLGKSVLVVRKIVSGRHKLDNIASLFDATVVVTIENIHLQQRKRA